MIAHATGRYVDEMIEDPVRLLFQLRSLYEKPSDVPQARIDELAARILHQEPFFESVEIVDAQGVVKRVIPEDSDALGLDRSRQEFFRQIRQGQQTYWSPSFISTRTGQPTVVLAIPMGQEILAGYLDLERIFNLSKMFTQNFGKDTFITVADVNGVYISHYETERVLQRQTAEEFASLHGRTPEQRSFRASVAGREMLVSFEKIEEPGWHVIVYQSYDDAFLLLRRIELFFGLSAMFCVIVAILASRRELVGVLNSFAALNRRFAAVAAGDFGGRIELGRFTELNEIAGHFNRMLDSIRERDEKLQAMAYQDPLTELPNRAFFARCLAETVRDRSPDRKFAVVYLDLDNFKTINDAHGHWRGDQVLKAVGERLRQAAKEDTLIARIGGDEFVFLVKDWDGNKGLEWLEEIREMLAVPIQMGSYSFYTGASIGVAVFPDDSRDADELLKYADMAMYQVKGSGRNGYRLYNTGMMAEFRRRTQIEEALRNALARHEFFLQYQPLVSADGRRLRGFEALIRWNSGSLGPVSPLELIPAAEEMGLIHSIGRWVMRTAGGKLAELTRRTGRELIFAVNVSALQLKDADFISDVADVMKECGLSSGQLELEITESAVVDSMEDAVSVLRQLRTIGVNISLDDFGTGYSSLSYLHQLPIHTVKIDKSFFRAITETPRAQDMLSGIVHLSKLLGLDVVAEGIETAEQAEFIAKSGCDFAQGYYFRRPMPEQELEAYCAAWPAAGPETGSSLGQRRVADETGRLTL